MQETAVVPCKRITASADRDDLVHFACEGVIRRESLVDLLVGPLAVFPCAGLFGGEDACPELSAPVAVGVARVGSHAPSNVCTRRRGSGSHGGGVLVPRPAHPKVCSPPKRSPRWGVMVAAGWRPGSM